MNFTISSYDSRSNITTELNGFNKHPRLVGLFNELLVAEPHDDVALLFDYGIQEGLAHGTIVANTGDGQVTDTDGAAVLSSTTGTSKMYSRDRVSYRPGRTTLARFTTSFNGPGVGRSGVTDDDNGFYLEYNNNVLSVNRRKAGVVTTETSLNGDDLSGIDWNNIQICYIMYGFLGVGNISFWVLDSKGIPKKIHEFETIGKLQSTHVRNPTLRFQAETSGDMELKIGSVVIQTFGTGEPLNTLFFTKDHSISLLGSETDTIVTYRNVASFEYKAGTSISNKKRARLLNAQFFIDPPASGTGVVRFSVTRPSSIATPTWVNLEQYNSVLEYDVSGTVSGESDKLIKFIPYMAATGNSGVDLGGEGSIDSDRLDLTAYPGDLISVKAENLGSNTVTCRVVLSFEEL